MSIDVLSEEATFRNRRTVGGKHRYLLRECDRIVADDIAAFQSAIVASIGEGENWSLQAIEAEHALLAHRLTRFGDCQDAAEIWRHLGWDDAESLAMLPTPEFITQAAGARRRAD